MDRSPRRTERIRAPTLNGSCSSGRPQVDDGEDHDPDQIDKMPIKADRLDRGRSACIVDLSAHREHEKDREGDHAHDYVEAVKPRKREERGAEEIATERYI